MKKSTSYMRISALVDSDARALLFILIHVLGLFILIHVFGIRQTYIGKSNPIMFMLLKPHGEL